MFGTRPFHYTVQPNYFPSVECKSMSKNEYNVYIITMFIILTKLIHPDFGKIIQRKKKYLIISQEGYIAYVRHSSHFITQANYCPLIECKSLSKDEYNIYYLIH